MNIEQDRNNLNPASININIPVTENEGYSIPNEGNCSPEFSQGCILEE